MSLEVRWADEAEFTFDAIVIFIHNGWGEKVADNFRDKVKKVLHSISQHPYLFPEADIAGMRKAVITKQTSLFYEIYNDCVYLTFFWDNRQDPLFE